jgi:hypothetical protein
MFIWFNPQSSQSYITTDRHSTNMSLLDIYVMVMTMKSHIKNHWVSGLCSAFGILK